MKINQNQNYNLFFFEDFDIYFFISLFEISRISDIRSENWKTQHKTSCVSVPHGFYLFGGGEDGGERGGVERGKWGEESD